MVNRVALVTGANKGIGFEIARGLGQVGYTVLAAARDRTRGGAAAAELAADGLDVRFVRLDVTDERSIAEAAARVSGEFGVLDVLVNNAGIVESLTAAPSQTTPAGMRSVYEVNVFGVIAVTNAMLGLLKRSAAGRIVNMSSGLGSLARQTSAPAEVPMLLSYSSSKTALNAITVQNWPAPRSR
jgi:NAD(P)-dependent dehydrogenase (short-subunit alcohol dehydrogenase family)